MKRLIFLSLLFLPGTVSLFAQSNEIIDTILAERELSAGSAAYLLLNIEPANAPADTSAAFTRLKSTYDLSSFTVNSEADPVSLGLYAYLLQWELSLPRGLGSRMFAGPRYALRDLKFLKIVQGSGEPSSSLSGERALRILGRALTEMEERP